MVLVDLPVAEELINPGAMTNAVRLSEFFWLCEQCCQSMRIVVENSGNVMLLAGSERQSIRCRKPAVAESLKKQARGRPEFC